jgi:hypothetical protein
MFDLATRAQALTLKSLGFPNAEIERITGIKPRTLRDLYQKALSRGFDPNTPKILDSYIEDAPRSGRPTLQTPRKTAKLEKLITKNRSTREMNTIQLGAELGISGTTVWRILRNGLKMRKTKPTRKPGLQKWMREERLQWCLDHQHWTLEDWKNVIWSDETSIVIGHRCGGYRI